MIQNELLHGPEKPEPRGSIFVFAGLLAVLVRGKPPTPPYHYGAKFLRLIRRFWTIVVQDSPRMRWTAPIIYLIVSPIHPKVTFHPSVKPFVMEAQNASPENFYVQSAELNRKPLTRAWLRYDEIGQGGHLKVLMGPEAATVTRVADLMVQDAAPRGRLQDDDCGTMSAWVILAQSGIYPMHPDAGIYVLCPPAFPEVRIDPGRGGRPLRIRGGGPPPRTIHAAHWQGAALDRPWLFAADLIHGGELTFTCGPPPSSWCRNPPPMPTPLNLTDQTASQRKESP